MPTVTVQSVLVDAAAAGPKLPDIELVFASETVSLAKLISRAVVEQVERLTHQMKLDTSAARQALERQYLSSREVVEQSASGRVTMPSTRDAQELGEIDIEREIHRAIEAFRAGVYRVLVNGDPIESLEAELTLAPDTEITFFRMIPLVGG